MNLNIFKFNKLYKASFSERGIYFNFNRFIFFRLLIVTFLCSIVYLNVFASKGEITLKSLTDVEEKQIKIDAEKTKKVWEIRSSKYLSEATLKRHLRAQQFLVSKNYDRTLEILNKVLNRSSSTSYEVAKTRILEAKALMAQDKLSKAELALTQALDSNSLGYSESCEALISLAQVQMMAKNYIESKKNILRYIVIAPEAPAQFVMLAAIDFQLENFSDAKTSIKKALTLTKDPQEPWLYLAANIYYKNKNYPMAEKYYLSLIKKRQNNKNYWMALVGVLFEQNKIKQATAYFEMAEKLGYVESETERLSRVGLLFSDDIPYKAANILEKDLNSKKIESKKQNYESLAGYWFASKEFDKAVKAYEKASSYSDNGKVDLMLGQVYLEMEDWTKAQKSFSKALKKGELKEQTGQAYVGLGLASFFNNEKSKAIKYFSKAKSFKKQKDTAEKWMTYLN